MYLSLYTFTLLSNLVSIDKLIGISIQEGFYLKNDIVWGRIITELNADLVLARKQLL